MYQTGIRTLVLTLITGAGLLVSQGLPLHAAEQASGSDQSPNVSFPATLRNLPTEPVGLGVFGSKVVFPQFTVDGRSSAFAVYDTTNDSLTRYVLPAAAQGQFAYAVAADSQAGILWVGTAGDLIGFNVASSDIRVAPLPVPAYPYLAPTERAPVSGWSPTNVLGLAVGPGAVWITRDHDSGLTSFDPATGRFSQDPLPAGVVPGAITVLTQSLVAVVVQHTGNPRYEVHGATFHTGYLIVNTRSGLSHFTARPTVSLVATAAGKLVTLGWPHPGLAQTLEQVDPGTNTVSAVGTTGGPSVNGSFGRSERDGSIWLAAGAEIDHLTPSGVVRYAIPIWTGEGPTIPPPPPGQPNTVRPLEPVTIYPDAAAVAAGPNGDAWFVAAGYNAIGHVMP